MNFDKYTNFKVRPVTPISSSSRRVDPANKPKMCLNCGNTCENKGTHLYYQKFCSDRCKAEYMENGSAFFKSPVSQI